ncbi:MAG: hypothetical protein A2W52_00770 [Candidatus Taylorbacteria bacterium RIFCSPHIGHO2_02_49_25]|uniref:DUF4446 domain-containing protein n=1 Tax=Candidatus Taylorbacteria bacterium RIFCSPHIGHO2_02_49_25 TaxID=1802305 RepID=A0A1G2ME83_9BACT|nr:MAG: hypothetical protein UY62_C0093G0005 [Parcubacteria group bacterium GW2011_GWF2_50_9]OHA19825.1 MAG: hypothetical protein A2759_01450 [Candidatus Taylorbacteria bacterium RIFCSPHIGHO2_01_FULL_49_60]OHA22198.1 MAG: hypothetical protein A2W52_00770 [Candidatus Taylorbacteria bacterium RIFCSPHIGHO2_02_49_25]OHA35603.1 MAG: hypothetical protein A3B27_01930 [Candidatus Taylorbacteria bacterium RIFCSPLOWO2_01_FULL_50_130]OHA36077.1 MAG: hypothetical protein A2W65_04320 [Candidatus Taylorbacte
MELSTDTLLFIFAAAAVIAVFLGLHTEWRMNRLLRGKSGKTLEEIIIRNSSDIEKFRQFRKELESYLETVEKRLQKSVCGVGTVRFNPFKGTGAGGNTSFATAFLDEKENGVVLSTLYARERVGVYAKPIRGGTSEHELTNEEKEAIANAKKQLHL